MSVPLLADGQFAGMFAAVVSLDPLQARLRDVSVRDRTVYIVDVHGHIVAYPDTTRTGARPRRHLHFPDRQNGDRASPGAARHYNHQFLTSRQGRAPSLSRCSAPTALSRSCDGQ